MKSATTLPPDPDKKKRAPRKEMTSVCLHPDIRRMLIAWLKATRHKSLSGWILFCAKRDARRNAKAIRKRKIAIPSVVFDN